MTEPFPNQNEDQLTRRTIVKLGDNIDSWCGKCHDILAHTIETLVKDKPARVQCNICKSQHSYKASEPGRSRQPRVPEADSSVVPRAAKTANRRYQTLLKGKDMADARSYSTKDTYSPGDVMDHPSFGFGIATAIKEGTKVEVLFENGPKVLVQGR